MLLRAVFVASCDCDGLLLHNLLCKAPAQLRKQTAPMQQEAHLQQHAR